MLEVASEPVNARLPGEETINRHPPASSTKLGKIDRLTRILLADLSPTTPALEKKKAKQMPVQMEYLRLLPTLLT